MRTPPILTVVNDHLKASMAMLMASKNGMEWYQAEVKPVDWQGDVATTIRGLAEKELNRLIAQHEAKPNGGWLHYQRNPQRSWLDEMEWEQVEPMRFRFYCISNFVESAPFPGHDQQLDQFAHKVAGTPEKALLKAGLETYTHLMETLFPESPPLHIYSIGCTFPLCGQEADLWGEFLLSDGKDAYLYCAGLND